MKKTQTGNSKALTTIVKNKLVNYLHLLHEIVLVIVIDTGFTNCHVSWDTL